MCLLSKFQDIVVTEESVRSVSNINAVIPTEIVERTRHLGEVGMSVDWI